MTHRPIGNPTTEPPAPPAVSYPFLRPGVFPDEIGRLGRYRVLRVLGSGGMGFVFHAEDPDLQRSVALKVMRPAVAAGDNARERFLREARAAAAIEHDHIVSIFEVGEDQGVPFLAMQLLKGESLEERLRRQKRLAAAQAAFVGRQLAEGLAAAHERGLIHRDVKPSNVWLEAVRDRVKILDFGLVRSSRSDGATTPEGTIMGTPAYMAPEQCGSGPVDARCDLFSLGCVLYESCTGVSPFQRGDTVATVMAVIGHEPPSPDRLSSSVPLPLARLVMSLLAKDPCRRPASAAEVARSLAEVEHSVTTMRAAASAPAETRPARPGADRRAALALTAVLIGVLGVVGLMSLRFMRGVLVVDCPEPGVLLVVRHGAEIVDRTSHRHIPLRPGDYDLNAEPDADWEAVPPHVTVSRGARQPVRLARRPSAGPNR